MIEYVLGVPGSGKTYKPVNVLHANFSLNEKLRDSKFMYSDVDFAYTNINELKLDCFVEGTIKKLEWDLFYENLSLLHANYKDQKTDSELIEIAKNYDLFRCLIILDECHNFLDKNDKVLTWWLSYHRHLHHQIYLITQNLSLVNSKYKSFSEFFYLAKPSSLKLFKSQMIYTQYTNSRLTQASKVGSIKIPFVKEIYDSYHSGANQQSQNIIRKFLGIAIFFFVLLIGIIFGIKSYFTKDLPVESSQNQNESSEVIASANTNTNLNSNNSNSQTDSKNTIPAATITDEKLYKFNCFKSLCYYKIDNKNDFIIPSQILSNYLSDIEQKNIYYEFSGIRFTIYVMSNNSKFNFITNGVQNEQNQNTITDALSLPGFNK
jgi:zona occludens toxin